jgi:predicted naringenin-chalcone synthase
MSSATVLFILNKIFSEHTFAPGERCMLLAFGAGLSCHGMLLEYVSDQE